MFAVKICGIRRPDDAALAAKAGADAIGLNFYAGSKRHVKLEVAALISVAANTFHPNLWVVGVFVNASAQEIYSACQAAQLTAIQLHGSEPPELLQELPDLPIIKAFGLKDATTLSEITSYVRAAEELGRPLAGVLVDGFRPGEFGGTGTTSNWGDAKQLREVLGGLPLVLAGGLTSQNVEQAIAAVQPAAVDTASGVESEPGLKDAQKVLAFVQAAKRGLAAFL